MFTPDEARALFEQIAKEAPSKLVAANNSVLLDALEQIDELKGKLDKLVRAVMSIASSMNGQPSAEPATEEEAAPETAPVASDADAAPAAPAAPTMQEALSRNGKSQKVAPEAAPTPPTPAPGRLVPPRPADMTSEG